MLIANVSRICCVWAFETLSYPPLVKLPKRIKNSKCGVSTNAIDMLQVVVTSTSDF